MDKVEGLMAMSAKDRYFEMRRFFCDGNMAMVKSVSKLLKKRRLSKLGNWDSAIKIFFDEVEPILTQTAYDKKYVSIDLPSIENYPVFYFRTTAEDGIFSSLVMVNERGNSCVVKHFSRGGDKKVGSVTNFVFK